MIVNLQQLNAYLGIFGVKKMSFLWREYLEQSAQAWKDMEHFDWDARRSRFHNWRSGSLVFGMEDFAVLCTRIEENILKKRFAQLPKQINESKTLYEESILRVKQIMRQMETGHE